LVGLAEGPGTRRAQPRLLQARKSCEPAV